jgi:hypothetical protein
VDPTGFDETGGLIPEIIVEAGGGPGDPYTDVAAGIVEILDDIGLGELFGAGPALSPAQLQAQAHGINLSSPLQGPPGFQSASGITSLATEGGTDTVPQILVQAVRLSPEAVQGFASSAGAFLFGADLAVSTEPPPDPSMLDQIDVNGVRYGMHGFDPISLAPGGAALECIILKNCSWGGWLLAGIGAIPGGSLESAGIGWTGRIGEDALKQLGGESQVFFRTTRGARFIDQLVNGVANESKVGYQSLTQDLATQIAKDVELVQSGQIQGSVWHFFVSPVTGLGGPSGPLLQALRQAGITVIIH